VAAHSGIQWTDATWNPTVGCRNPLAVLTFRRYDQRMPETVQRRVVLASARWAGRSGEGRRIRTAAGLSIGEVARRVGVDESTVSRWERGLCWPSGPRANAYIRLLAAVDRRPAVRRPAPAWHPQQVDLLDLLAESVPA
jgi:DNA-binding transcriptional regulator YiaG